MKRWTRWLLGMAWIGWLLSSWCSAQLTPRLTLPGGTVTWTLPIAPASGGGVKVTVGNREVTLKSVVGHDITFVIPLETFEGVVPVTAIVSGQHLNTELIVEGQDAQVGHDIKDTKGNPTGEVEVTVDWLECNLARNKSTIWQELNLLMKTPPRDVKVIKPRYISVYPLGGNVGACHCQVVEVSVAVLTSTDPATRANALGSVLETLRGLNDDQSPRSTLPEPLIVRSSMTHGLYHAGPDHVPLTLSRNSPIDPIDFAKLNFPTPDSKKVLVAVLDTGLSPMAKSSFFTGTLLQQNTFTQSGSTTMNPVDPFDVQKAQEVQEGIPGLPLNQGTGHGTPIAWIVNQEAGKLINILPISVCDKEGLCRDPQVMQGLCYAAGFYSKVSQRYPGGLVINLSLGSFTPSDSLRAVLDDVTMKSVTAKIKPWVVAAAGNYIPDETKRRALEGKTAPTVPPVYIPGIPNDWIKFSNRYPYAMVFPAGFGVDSSAPGVPAGLFTANDHIVGVGSLEHLKTPAQWPLTDTSMRGRHVKVCAPGRYVISRDVNGTSASYSGTSYAAPVFTGLLATVLSKTPFVQWSTLSSGLQYPIRTVCQ